jgi:hypothetical protein
MLTFQSDAYGDPRSDRQRRVVCGRSSRSRRRLRGLARSGGARPGDFLPGPRRSVSAGVFDPAGLVRAQEASADTAGDLAARARRRRAGEHPAVGRPAGTRRVRRHQSRGPGPQVDALLVGRPRRDSRPRTDAADRGTRHPVAADRASPRVRIRRQHGRTGDASPARAVSALACRCGGLRCADEHGGALPGIRSASLRRRTAEAREARDRRHTGHGSRRIRNPQPTRLCEEDRPAGVPLQIWWSTCDRTVSDQKQESGLLYRDIKQFNPGAPVSEFVGAWAHTTEMRAHGYLPYALSRFGLMPSRAAPPRHRRGGDSSGSIWS